MSESDRRHGAETHKWIESRAATAGNRRGTADQNRNPIRARSCRHMLVLWGRRARLDPGPVPVADSQPSLALPARPGKPGAGYATIQYTYPAGFLSNAGSRLTAIRFRTGLRMSRAPSHAGGLARAELLMAWRTGFNRESSTDPGVRGRLFRVRFGSACRGGL